MKQTFSYILTTEETKGSANGCSVEVEYFIKSGGVVLYNISMLPAILPFIVDNSKTYDNILSAAKSHALKNKTAALPAA